MTPNEIISDAEIERVHANANFGSMTKRRVVDEGALKYLFGYTTGSTQRAILIEHGLIRPNRSERFTLAAHLTPKGKKYLRAIASETGLETLLDTLHKTPESASMREINLIPGANGGDEVCAFDRRKMDSIGVDNTTLMCALAKAVEPFAILLREGCGFGVIDRADDVSVIGVTTE